MCGWRRRGSSTFQTSTIRAAMIADMEARKKDGRGSAYKVNG